MKFYLLSFAVLCGIGGFFFGADVEKTKWIADTQTKINQAVSEARSEEKIKQDKVNATIQVQITQLNSINDSLQRDLIGLRNRPSRRDVSRDSQVDCKGTDGRSLFREDAEAFTRLAAEADKDRAGRIACEAYADALQ